MRNALRFALLLCLFALSCAKDDTVYYGLTEMGTVSSGNTIVSDNGLAFKVTEDESKTSWWAMKRVIFNYDILARTGANTYNIRLLAVAEPIVADLVPVAPDAPWTDTDPAFLYAAWEGGGYLNLGIGFLYNAKSGVKHEFSLECRQVPACDTLYLHIVHDAGGEFLGAEGVSDGSLKSGVRYASFPLADYVPAGTSRPAVLSWRFHPEDEEGKYQHQVEDFSLKGTLTQ